MGIIPRPRGRGPVEAIPHYSSPITAMVSRNRPYAVSHVFPRDPIECMIESDHRCNRKNFAGADISILVQLFPWLVTSV